LKLVCVGGTELDVEEVTAMERLGLTHRVMRRVAADSALSGLYAGAQAFVFPSLYEGFGLPVLEAFASGCPALLADIPCFQESADDAALFFPGALSEALGRSLTDGSLRETLVRRVFSGGSPSPVPTARQTVDIYRQML